MNGHTFTTKRLLASALLTGLLGAVPIIGDDIFQNENAQTTQEQVSLRIDSHLCNKFQCSKTGLIVKFLPNAKALLSIRTQHKPSRLITLFILTAISLSMCTWKSFQKIWFNDARCYDPFRRVCSKSVNREDRYFQKVWSQTLDLKSDTDGQWSEPVISCKIKASSSDSIRSSEMKK